MQTSIRADILVVLGAMVLVILLPLGQAIFPRVIKASNQIAAISLGVSTTLLVFLAVIFDGILGISASWLFTFGVWILGCGIGLAIRLRYRSVFALVVIGLLTVFVTAQHFMDWTPVKPYRRFFAAIEPGMTKAKVLTLLGQEFPDGSRFPRPVQNDFTQEQMWFLLDPTESGFNAEGISVHLRNGMVVTKDYSRD